MVTHWVLSLVNGCFAMGAGRFSLCPAITVAIGAGLSLSAMAGPFTVGDVSVDASGSSAQQAQARALATGQSIALSRLYKKLTLESDHAQLPAVEAGDLERLVRSYEVARERHSSQRYIADLTVHFDPDGVRRALRSAHIPFAETESPSRLVLPLLESDGALRLWEEPNPWRDAWHGIGWRHHLVNLVLPYGELEDLTTVSAEQARNGDANALSAVADRYSARETLVALARLESGGGVGVTATRHVGDESTIVFSRHIAAVPNTATTLHHVGDESTIAFSRHTAAVPNTAATLRQAALTMAETLESDWKLANLVDFSSLSTLDISTRLTGLENWLSIRRRFDSMSQLAGTQIVSLSRSEAQLTLRYYGALGSLSDALDSRGLSLIDDGGGGWRIETKDVATPLPEPDQDLPEQASVPTAMDRPAAAVSAADGETDPEEDLLFE